MKNKAIAYIVLSILIAILWEFGDEALRLILILFFAPVILLSPFYLIQMLRRVR